MSVFLYFCSIALLLFFLRRWGVPGVFVYTTLTLIASNIQVLKASLFPFTISPIALGSILFMSLFLANDILTENYGATVARRNIWMGFAAYLTFTFFMVITLAYPPLASSEVFYTQTHNALMTLFLPSPMIFIASLLAYLISQRLEVTLFRRLKEWSHRRHLWVRTFVSLFLGLMVDNLLFSFLAWYILIPSALTVPMVLDTYVWGSLVERSLCIFGYIPALYLSRRMVRS